MKTALRNRIKAHRRIRFGDLVPHEANPRRHTPAQREVLKKLYAEIGFARSLLAYELPDGRLKLIDGHLRAGLTPDEVLDVEVLDITDAEARFLLLSIDPLAQLASHDADALTQLRQVAEQDSEAVQMLWRNLEQETASATQPPPDDPPQIEEQYLILIECADEDEQVELLRRFQIEGLKCAARIA